MNAKVALCIEEEACKNPQIVGLGGEALEALRWLDVYTSGREARKALAENKNAEELWVVSCEDVEPINLAASIKSDQPHLCVRLITTDPCGSLLSRAHTANIDEVIGYSGFVHRYANAKREFGRDSAESGEQNANDPSGPLVGGGSKADLTVPLDTVLAAPSATVVEEITPPVEVVAPERKQAVSIARFLQFQVPAGQAVTAVDNRSFVITVVSGSGGAGKSAVSTLGALIANSWGYKTLLLDCDLQFGDVASMVGVEQPLCIDEVLSRPDRFESEVVQGGQFVVLAAPSRLEVSEAIVRQLPALLERVSELFDVVVVNTGASWAEQHAMLLERSSVALFLVDQRVSSVRACRHALELCARCGIAASPFQYALNRCAKGAPLSAIDVSSALQGAPVFELKDGGRDVEDYLSSGAARDLIQVKNEFAKSVEKVMERLLPNASRMNSATIEVPDEKRAFRRRGRHGSSRRGKK